MIVNSSVPTADDVAGVDGRVETMPLIGARMTASPSCALGAGQPRPGVGQLRLGGRDVVAGDVEIARRQRAGARPAVSVRSASRRATAELILGRAHGRRRRLPRVVERARLDAAEQRAAADRLPFLDGHLQSSSRRSRRARSLRAAAAARRR